MGKHLKTKGIFTSPPLPSFDEIVNQVDFEKNEQKNYIEERMKFYAGNISNFAIDNLVIRKKDNKICKITNLTKNSIEVYIKTYSDIKCDIDYNLEKRLFEIKRYSNPGISATQWFSIKDFEKEFKLYNHE